MKSILFSITALVMAALSIKAQDTIYTRNGEKINAKVIEIGQNEVKYKKAANPDGPVYTSNRSDLMFIQYRNGSKDIFAGQGSNDSYAAGNAGAATQPQNTTNNYYQAPQPRPGVNVVVAPPIVAPIPYGYYGWGWRRPYYYRPHYYGGGYYHHHHWH